MKIENAIELFAAKAQNIYRGSASNFAHPGQYVWVKVGTNSLRCKAATIINSTQVAVMIADNGEAFVFCDTAPKVVRKTVNQWVKGRLVEGEDPRPSILYAYLTGGSTPTKTALYVAGTGAGSVLIDEWANSEHQLHNATIDNLGGGNFIVSYVLRRLPMVMFANGPSYNHLFKVATNKGIVFSQTVDARYSETGPSRYYTLSNIPGFLSPGYGNWVSNKISDLESSGNAVFRLSSLELNPDIDQQLDLIPYQAIYQERDVTHNSWNVDVVLNLSSAYLTPSIKRDQYFYLNSYEYVYNQYVARQTVERRAFDTSCIRYNANGKSLVAYRDSDWTLTLGSFVYSGYDYAGIGIIPSRGAQLNKIPFKNVLKDTFTLDTYMDTYMPVVTDYSILINCTRGSNTATYISGAIPAVGALVTVNDAFSYGTKILEVNGNTIKFSTAALVNATDPAEPALVYMGFPSGGFLFPSSTSTIEGKSVDLLPNGVSYFPTSVLSQRKTRSAPPRLLSETIEIPVALFGDDLRPSADRYDTVRVYPPTAIAPGASGIVGAHNFSIKHASYKVEA